MSRPKNIEFPRSEWLSWEEQVRISGYEDGYSLIALRLFLLILFKPEILEYFTETTKRGYPRAYYDRNKAWFQARNKKWCAKVAAERRKKKNGLGK